MRTVRKGRTLGRTMRACFFGMAFIGLGVVAAEACSVGTAGTGLAPGSDAGNPLADGSREDIVDGSGKDEGTDGEGDESNDADAGSGIDARPDTGRLTLQDASGDAYLCNRDNCSGACCGNVCTDPSCSSCASGHLFCPNSTTVANVNGQCVASCDACPLFPAGSVTCYSCTSGAATGSCASDPSRCPQAPPASACTCVTGSCPDTNQVCVNGTGGGFVCEPCGLPGTQGLVCGQGTQCDQGMSACGH
jgi:hypothetical protein